jgi:hypothetical protein
MNAPAKNYRVRTPTGSKSKWVSARDILSAFRAGRVPKGSWVERGEDGQRCEIEKFALSDHEAAAQEQTTQAAAVGEHGNHSDTISFLCTHCRAKLKGKADLAGRQFRCPMCKLPTAVPLAKTLHQTAVDPDVQRQITYSALKAASLLQETIFNDPELAARYNAIFAFLPRPDQREWVPEHILQRTARAWDICEEVSNIIDRHGLQHRQCWLTCMDKMQVIANKPPRKVVPNWREMRGVEFEQFLGSSLRALNFTVKGTNTTGDQGVDLIAVKSGIRLAIQAKGYAGAVGNDSVQQAFAGMKYYDCTCCAVITNSRFTPQARELARKLQCILVGGPELLQFLDGEITIEELLLQMRYL